MSRDLGFAWHGVAGIVVGALLVFGVSRELAQHPGDLVLFWHQWLEALAWPAGALLVIVPGSLLLGWIKRRRKPR